MWPIKSYDQRRIWVETPRKRHGKSKTHVPEMAHWFLRQPLVDVVMEPWSVVWRLGISFVETRREYDMLRPCSGVETDGS